MDSQSEVYSLVWSPGFVLSDGMGDVPRGSIKPLQGLATATTGGIKWTINFVVKSH